MLCVNELYAQGTSAEKSSPFEYLKHKAGVDIISPFGKEILFHYEYLFSKQKVSIRVPLGFSYNKRGYPFKFFSNTRKEPFDIDFEQKTYPYISRVHEEKRAIHTGMDFLIYFSKARRVRPYFAPGIFLGMFIWEKRSQLIDFDGVNYHYTRLDNETSVSWIVGAEAKVGMQIMAHKRISIAIEGGAGIGKHYNKNTISGSMLGIRRGSLIFAYHFRKIE